MIVKNMRASQGVLRAEVSIGQKDNGGYVTTMVVLDRRTDEVKAAFATLENVLLREAQDAIDQAVTRNARRKAEERQAVNA